MIKDIKGVQRIAGEDRHSTNAAIVKKFFGNGTSGVIVVKDGQGNINELIDAVTTGGIAGRLNDKGRLVRPV